MCIQISGIHTGLASRTVYDKMKEAGYEYTKLDGGKFLNNAFRLTKGDIDFVIGGNSNNIVAMFTYAESIPTSSINKKYIDYLELFYSSGYRALPDSLKRQIASSDTDITFLNGGSNHNQDFVIIGYFKDPKNSDNSIWISIVVSPSLMGFSKPRRQAYTRSKNESSEIDAWDIIGGASAVAGLFGLFS